MQYKSRTEQQFRVPNSTVGQKHSKPERQYKSLASFSNKAKDKYLVVVYGVPVFAHLIKGIEKNVKGKKKTLFLSPHTFSYSCVRSFPSQPLQWSCFPVFFPFWLSSLQLHIFGFNQTRPGASPGSHGGFDLFHRTAELWLGSPTLSSVCSSLLLSSTSSTASHYSSVIAIYYTLCLISTVIFCS